MSQEDQIQFKRRVYLFKQLGDLTLDEIVDCENIRGYIAVRRSEAGLTQTGLAKRLGVARRTVTRWECTDAAPGLSQLPALAAALEPTGRGLLHSILAYRPPPERRC